MSLSDFIVVFALGFVTGAIVGIGVMIWFLSELVKRREFNMKDKNGEWILKQ